MTELESNYLSNFVDRGTSLICLMSNDLNAENTEFKRLPNLKLNFLQDIEQLKKQIARCVRMSPDEPMYGISKIEIFLSNEYVELTPSLLKEFSKTRLFNFQTAIDKFHVKVVYDFLKVSCLAVF